MPEYTKYANLRYPTGAEANNVPSDLAALAGGVDTHVVLYATDEADRDARFGDVAAGTIVSSTISDTIWKCTGPGVWIVVGGDDTGWQPVALRSGAAWRTTFEGVARAVGGIVYFGGQYDTTQGSFWGQASTVTIGTLPNGWVFPYQINFWQRGSSSWQLFGLPGSGDIVTFNGPPTSTAAQFSGTFPLG